MRIRINKHDFLTLAKYYDLHSFRCAKQMSAEIQAILCTLIGPLAAQADQLSRLDQAGGIDGFKLLFLDPE